MRCEAGGWRQSLMFGIIALGLIGQTRAADDQLNLRTGAQRLGDAVGKWFNEEMRERQITVAAFVNDDGEQSAGFKQLVEQNLTRVKPPFEVRRAEIVLSGRLDKSKEKANPEDRFESVALSVEARLNQRGRDGDLQKFKINVFGDEALQHLGPSAEFPAGQSEVDKQKQLDRQLGTAPEAFVSGTQTLGAANGEFGIEILVHKGNSSEPRSPKPADGRSFVKLVQGEEYLIRLFNRSSEEAAVALTIDGLSMFAFAEDGSSDSFVLIPAGKFVEIPGWYITDKQTDVFEVSNYAKSAAAVKNFPATGVGVITARFHISQSGDGKGDEATKRGRRIDQEYKQERRIIGATRAFVTVRYNRDGK